MSDTDTILQALKDNREENRRDIHELRQAVVKIADAASEMGKTMARSEERHSNHEGAVKRMSRVIDDHEGRLRIIETDYPKQIEAVRSIQANGRSSVAGGWKVLTVQGALLVGIIAAGTALIKLAQ